MRLSLAVIFWGRGYDSCDAETVALWLFDEQVGMYPSCVLGDAASGNFPLVIGAGGQLVEGRFGNALEPVGRPQVSYPPQSIVTESGKPIHETLESASKSSARMSWLNAYFAALMTRGEQHLRQEVEFGSPTASGLNLGESDWTVEFWYRPVRPPERSGVVFEIGKGPRHKNDAITQLSLHEDGQSFSLLNDPADLKLRIPSSSTALDASGPDWHHLAFAYDKSEEQLRHYVDGVLQPLPDRCEMKPLPIGKEDYMSVGRDGRWQHRLPGQIDELRFSDTQDYHSNFTPPDSFSRYSADYSPPSLSSGPPLLFAEEVQQDRPVELGSRKYLFLDDSLLATRENIEFRVNPPRLDKVIMESRGLSNHLVVFEDSASGDGLVRIYGRGPLNSLAVWTSEDGVNFTAPDLGREYHGARNIVVEDPVGLGTIFVDPNAPPEERIKYISGYRGRGLYVYSSPDGYHFTRNESSALPFRGASQSIVFYDEQRQRYVGYHRSDMARFESGKTARTSVMTETTDLMRPWPLKPVLPDEQTAMSKTRRLGWKNPYYTDNGPLTPPGFGVEFPTVFAPIEKFDPVGTDIYVPKCIKYPWADDTYLAFPVMYFHYHEEDPLARQALGTPEADRGSGPLETQLSVSRDGIRWQRYPRPAYIGIGRHAGFDLKKAYIGHGMVRRGEEIWQYYVGSEEYHSPWKKNPTAREAVFRVVQRFDGFVSADTPYTGGTMTTRPLVFSGNRLVINLDTDATGYAQVGLLDEHGAPIEGFELDECIYLNGDFIDTEVEWLKAGKDVSALAGRTIKVVVRSRGTKLYSMQFVEREQ
ncbi:hypothetical protein Pla144_22850 [Bythopirellula polymerisocia]|uniref:LamG-like jellyroll fold domain-containing protein n=2 Tax=Bythopirellula polymerisocia TaxID=2528003 RepID=A0A5C6CVN9_9BACT|nr:hypothetical protein Pla144_22850 [Bythopirellula polymerisocia]